LTRKFINREDKKGLDAKKDVTAEDEWAHLAEGEDGSIETKIEEKIEAADAADVSDRSITFGNQQQVGPKTKFDIVREEARNAMDAAGNTGQYIKLLPKPDVKTITESLHQLLLEKGITKAKLDNLKNEIGAVEEELQQQENQIEEVSEEIKNKKLVPVNEDKKEKMKEDLETLMKKYGVTNISDLEKFMK